MRLEPEKNKNNEIVQKKLFDLDPRFGFQDNEISFNDKERDDLLVNLMALKSIKGIGFKTLCNLFDIGFIQKVWHLDAKEINKQWSSIHNHPKVDLVKEIASSEQTLLNKGKKAAEALKKYQIDFIPRGHRRFPKSLERLAEPPRWIFVKGRIDVLHSNSVVAVVGTRNATSDGLHLAYLCSIALAKHNVIVLSGLAKGIDEEAHKGATEYYGQTIAVLGHGLLAIDMSSNKSLWARILETDGAIISEYFPNDPPSRQNFLRRNELQAALSKAVIPVECPSLESGTGATIRRALNIKTPVVGVRFNNHNGNKLVTTMTNLTKLGIPIFPLETEQEIDIIGYLSGIITAHDWNENPEARQNRLFRVIENIVLENKEKVGINKTVIDRLAMRLKKKIENNGGAV